jgi:hypothetical protein
MDGGLEIRAEPADETALFFGGAFVVEGDEAGEDGLFERLGIGTATGEDVGQGSAGILPALGG